MSVAEIRDRDGDFARNASTLSSATLCLMQENFTEGLLTYATGRKLEYYDMPTIRRIVRGAAGSDYRFSALVQAVVRSEQFRMHRVGGAGGPVARK